MSFIVLLRLLISGLALTAPVVRSKPMPPDIVRKVARIELARSIRAFAAGSLAHGECLVRNGQLSREQADQATAIALQEMGINASMLDNPQVRKAADLLRGELKDSCDLSSLDDETARQLVQDEL